MTHSHLLEHSKLARNKGRLICKHYTLHKVQMQKLSTLLALTALTCQPKNQCRITVSCSQSEADTILISAYAVLLYCLQWACWLTQIIYVAAAAISQKLPGLLCIKRQQATILCRNLVPEEMADCIVLLHCLTGCDANSAREEAIEELFVFTRLVVCGDKVSRTMGTAQAAKWKAMKNKSFIRLPPDG